MDNLEEQLANIINRHYEKHDEGVLLNTLAKEIAQFVRGKRPKKKEANPNDVMWSNPESYRVEGWNACIREMERNME